MPDYFYICTKVNNLHIVHGHFVADLEFKNEHGHAMTPVKEVPISIVAGDAQMVAYPDDLLSGEDEDEIWKEFTLLCKNHPQYDVYNSQELAQMIGVADANN